MRKRLLPIGAIALCAGLSAVAGSPENGKPQQFRPVVLSVVATGPSGQAVADLKASDLRVLDDGSPRQITALRLDQASPITTVILLDLMDLNFQQRGIVAEQLRESLIHAPNPSQLYLYLLARNSSIYPVRALPPAGAHSQMAASGSWIQNSVALLDAALDKVNRARPKDFSLRYERLKATCTALENMDQLMWHQPGRKQFLWITYGVPSSIKFPAYGWVDFSRNLRQVGAEFNRGAVTVYTLDPSLRLGTLNRDGLEVLSSSTGGRTFGTSDVLVALKRMRDDASSTYLVKYEPLQTENWAGKRHNVKLSSAAQGVDVRAQQVYLADVN